MKLFSLLIYAILPFYSLAQIKYLGDTKSLAPIAFDTRISNMQVVNELGKTGNLGDYFNAKRKHTNKPVLLVTFGSGDSNRGFNSLKELAEERLDKYYDVIAIYIDWGKELSAKQMVSFIEKNEGKILENFLLVSTNFDALKASSYVEAFPRQIFTTSNFEIVAVTDINPSENTKILLDAIDAGTTKQDKIWFNDKGHFTKSNAEDVLYYTQYQIKPNYISLVNGTEKEVITNQTYHIIGNKFLQDGELISKNIDGSTLAKGNFKDGIPVSTFETFFDDGKQSSICPVDGTYKVFDEDGKIVMEGPMVKGLGNGVFNSFSAGKKNATYNYKMGELSGIQQQFLADGTITEWFASPEYEYTGYLSEGIQNVEKNKLYGYIDRTGKTIIPFIYESALPFEDGKASVTLKGEYFNIDKNGKRLAEEAVGEIPEVMEEPEEPEEPEQDKLSKYDKIYPYSSREGITRVQIKDKFGYVDAEGNEITAIEYDETWEFYEGMAAVKKDNKMGYINDKGKLVIPLKYLAGDMFIDGTARVAINENGTNKFGYVNKVGNEIIPVIYSYPRRSGDKYIITKKQGFSGMLDWSAKTVIPFDYQEINDFEEGRALVKKDGVYGFIDEQNRVVGEMKYAEARSFKEGRAAVKIMEGSLPLWGFVDIQGKIAVSFGKFSRVENFNDGYARVVDNVNYKWGMIDKTGKLIIPFKYSGISWNGYKEDIITAAIDKKWGAVDRANNVVIPFIYDGISDFAGGMLQVELNAKFGFVDKKGMVVIPIKYEAINDFEGEFAGVKIDGIWKKVNKKGEIVE